MCCAPPSRSPGLARETAQRPQADPFVGPAILSGGAAGVFFHEIFGHRIEGHRQSDLQEARRFPTASARAFCRISSASSSTRRCTTPPARISTAGTASTTKEFQRAA